MIEIRISAETPDELFKQIAGLIPTTTTTTTEPEPEEPKPRKSRKAKSEPAKQADPEPAKSYPALSYDKDVKPLLVNLASKDDAGRDKAASIVHGFGVSKGADIPVESLPEAMEQAKAALEAAANPAVDL